jgi:hypothetical protein
MLEPPPARASASAGASRMAMPSIATASFETWDIVRIISISPWVEDRGVKDRELRIGAAKREPIVSNVGGRLRRFKTGVIKATSRQRPT